MDTAPASMALPTAAIPYAESGEPASSGLPPALGINYTSGHVGTAAVGVPPVVPPVTAQGLTLGPAAAVVAAAGRDDNIVRALAFAEEPGSAAIVVQANSSSNSVGNAVVGDDANGGTSSSGPGEAVVCEIDPDSDETLSSSGETSVPATAANGDAAPSISKGSVNSATHTHRTNASWHGQHLAVHTNSSTSLIGTGTAKGLDPPVNGGTAAGTGGDESDVGSEDEDNEYFTWFSSQRRVRGGQRKHGRGNLRGGRVYDSIRINDNAKEMKTLRQQLAEGAVEESEGKKKLQQLEDKIYTIKVGDTIEIHSGNNSHPYVGTLILLDREKKMFRVRWFYLRHEVEERLKDEMGPKEILMCDAESDQDLSTVSQKVETVLAMPPNGEALPANTYLCYRGYDRRRKEFAPLLADGSLGRPLGRPPLDRKPRGKKKISKTQRAAYSEAGVGTPQRSSSSSTIMSPFQDDSDRLKRWNRIGAEFDVEVLAWTGPSTGKLMPPPEERNAVQRQLDEQQEWSSDRAAAPFEPENLTAYLNTAKDFAPILPGTIVYIKPGANGRWGDGHDREHARSNGASNFRWGLVSEAPSPGQIQLDPEQARSRSGGMSVGGASNVGMAQRVEMPSARKPPWFTELQQQQQQQQQRLGTGMQQHQHLMQHQQAMPCQVATPYPHHQHQHHKHALHGNANNHFQQQRQLHASFQHGTRGGNLTDVWIANPLEGGPPLQVERSRVVGREFEEEAMNVLWDARGYFPAAREVIYSKQYQAGLRARLAAAGDIWTFQQVEAAVETCTKVAAEREEQLGDVGEDENDYGVDRKAFHSVVDFSRRFNTLLRFGRPEGRRALVKGATASAGGAGASTTAMIRKRPRPKEGIYNDIRPKKPAVADTSGGRRAGGRSRGQAVKNYREVEDEEEEEEEEEEEDSSEDSDDTNYNPDDSEGSSVLFVRGKKRRRTRRAEEESAEEAAGSTSGYSSQEDRKDNIVIAKNETASPTAPTSPAPSDKIHDLCSSGEDDNYIDVHAKGVSAAGSSSDTRGPIVRRKGDGGRGDDQYQTMAPSTVAEAAAAAAVRETQGIAAEAAAKAEADGAEAENGGPAAAAGGGGGAGVPRARDDSPVPGVASGNTGGEAMAPRHADETGGVLHAFMDRVKATLNKEPFDKFVSALSQYREQHLAIDQLVNVVSECFNHREAVEMNLINEFNTFLPPGHAVPCTKT